MKKKVFFKTEKERKDKSKFTSLTNHIMYTTSIQAQYISFFLYKNDQMTMIFHQSFGSDNYIVFELNVVSYKSQTSQFRYKPQAPLNKPLRKLPCKTMSRYNHLKELIPDTQRMKFGFYSIGSQTTINLMLSNKHYSHRFNRLVDTKIHSNR